MSHPTLTSCLLSRMQTRPHEPLNECSSKCQKLNESHLAVALRLNAQPMTLGVGKIALPSSPRTQRPQGHVNTNWESFQNGVKDQLQAKRRGNYDQGSHGEYSNSNKRKPTLFDLSKAKDSFCSANLKKPPSLFDANGGQWRLKSKKDEQHSPQFQAQLNQAMNGSHITTSHYNQFEIMAMNMGVISPGITVSTLRRRPETCKSTIQRTLLSTTNAMGQKRMDDQLTVALQPRPTVYDFRKQVVAFGNYPCLNTLSTAASNSSQRFVLTQQASNPVSSVSQYKSVPHNQRRQPSNSVHPSMNVPQESRAARLAQRRQLSRNYAKPFVVPPKISAKSYVIMECDSSLEPGRFKKMHAALNSKNPQQIASLTKIMTCWLAIKIIREMQIDIQTIKVNVGKFETNINGTSAEIKEGEQYNLQQLLYGLMLPSGNDASLAVAVAVGKLLLKHSVNGSDCDRLSKKACYQRFIQQMNAEAALLKLSKTQFTNSHGLSNPLNKSCAFDIAVLAETCMRDEMFRKIVCCLEYSCQVSLTTPVDTEEAVPRLVTWKNTHKLLHSRPNEYIGVKTGMTTTAGPCLCSFIKIEERSFIIVVLACKKVSLRFKETEILKRWLYTQEKITSPCSPKRITVSPRKTVENQFEDDCCQSEMTSSTGEAEPDKDD